MIKETKKKIFENRKNYFENIENIKKNASINLGYRKLFFAQTFTTQETLITEMLKDTESKVSVAIYVHYPQILIDISKGKLNLIPEIAYRLELNKYSYKEDKINKDINIQLLHKKDILDINKIYKDTAMNPIDFKNTKENHYSDKASYFIAKYKEEIVGIVIGIDHKKLFNSPENGCSIFGLSVSPNARKLGIGTKLIDTLIKHFITKGKNYIDLYADYRNEKAIHVYKKLGFKDIQRFSIKRTKDTGTIKYNNFK